MEKVGRGSRRFPEPSVFTFVGICHRRRPAAASGKDAHTWKSHHTRQVKGMLQMQMHEEERKNTIKNKIYCCYIDDK